MRNAKLYIGVCEWANNIRALFKNAPVVVKNTDGGIPFVPQSFSNDNTEPQKMTKKEKDEILKQIMSLGPKFERNFVMEDIKLFNEVIDSCITKDGFIFREKKWKI